MWIEKKSTVLSGAGWSNYGVAITGNGQTATVPMATGGGPHGFYRGRVTHVP